MTSDRRRSSASERIGDLGLGELGLLQPISPQTAQREPAASVAVGRSDQDPDEAIVRAEVELPESVVNRAKALVRPRRTGVRRSLSVALVLQAYVRAVDALHLPVDTAGLDRGSEDEAVERVLAALQEWARKDGS